MCWYIVTIWITRAVVGLCHYASNVFMFWSSFRNNDSDNLSFLITTVSCWYHYIYNYTCQNSCSCWEAKWWQHWKNNKWGSKCTGREISSCTTYDESIPRSQVVQWEDYHDYEGKALTAPEGNQTSKKENKAKNTIDWTLGIQFPTEHRKQCNPGRVAKSLLVGSAPKPLKTRACALWLCRIPASFDLLAAPEIQKRKAPVPVMLL